MQVTLKKAAELSRAALAAAKAIEPKSNLTISAFSTAEVEQIVADGRTAFHAALSRSLALVSAAYAIRDLIASANDTAGVTKLLTKVAGIDESILRITAATGGKADAYADPATDTDDMSALKRRVEQSRKDALSESESRRYGRDEIKIAILDANEKQSLGDEIGALKRLRATHKDELTAINFSTKIDLPDSITGPLRAEKLID